MKLLCLVAAFLLPFVSYSQSIRTLSYNSSNNVVIGATNSTNALTWSNAFTWSTNTLAAATRTNLALGWSGLTNTTATSFREALELGTNDFVQFKGIYIGNAIYVPTNFSVVEFTAPIWIGETGTNAVFEFEVGAPDQAKARTNLGLPLAALTNTNTASFLSAIGALATNGSAAGLTNFPGVTTNISVVGTNNTNVLVFTNGLLMEVQ